MKDWTFRCESPPRIMQTWFRWVTSGGEVWCESRNRNEIPAKKERQLDLTVWAMDVYQVETAWRPA